MSSLALPDLRRLPAHSALPMSPCSSSHPLLVLMKSTSSGDAAGGEGPGAAQGLPMEVEGGGGQGPSGNEPTDGKEGVGASPEEELDPLSMLLIGGSSPEASGDFMGGRSGSSATAASSPHHPSGAAAAARPASSSAAPSADLFFASGSNNSFQVAWKATKEAILRDYQVSEIKVDAAFMRAEDNREEVKVSLLHLLCSAILPRGLARNTSCFLETLSLASCLSTSAASHVCVPQTMCMHSQRSLSYFFVEKQNKLDNKTRGPH